MGGVEETKGDDMGGVEETKGDDMGGVEETKGDAMDEVMEETGGDRPDAWGGVRRAMNYRRRELGYDGGGGPGEVMEETGGDSNLEVAEVAAEWTSMLRSMKFEDMASTVQRRLIALVIRGPELRAQLGTFWREGIVGYLQKVRSEGILSANNMEAFCKQCYRTREFMQGVYESIPEVIRNSAESLIACMKYMVVKMTVGRLPSGFRNLLGMADRSVSTLQAQGQAINELRSAEASSTLSQLSMFGAFVGQGINAGMAAFEWCRAAGIEDKSWNRAHYWVNIATEAYLGMMGAVGLIGDATAFLSSKAFIGAAEEGSFQWTLEGMGMQTQFAALMDGIPGMIEFQAIVAAGVYVSQASTAWEHFHKPKMFHDEAIANTFYDAIAADYHHYSGARLDNSQAGHPRLNDSGWVTWGNEGKRKARKAYKKSYQEMAHSMCEDFGLPIAFYTDWHRNSPISGASEESQIKTGGSGLRGWRRIVGNVFGVGLPHASGNDQDKGTPNVEQIGDMYQHCYNRVTELTQQFTYMRYFWNTRRDPYEETTESGLSADEWYAGYGTDFAQSWYDDDTIEGDTGYMGAQALSWDYRRQLGRHGHAQKGDAEGGYYVANVYRPEVKISSCTWMTHTELPSRASGTISLDEYAYYASKENWAAGDQKFNAQLSWLNGQHTWMEKLQAEKEGYDAVVDKMNTSAKDSKHREKRHDHHHFDWHGSILHPGSHKDKHGHREKTEQEKARDRFIKANKPYHDYQQDEKDFWKHINDPDSMFHQWGKKGSQDFSTVGLTQKAFFDFFSEFNPDMDKGEIGAMQDAYQKYGGDPQWWFTHVWLPAQTDADKHEMDEEEYERFLKGLKADEAGNYLLDEELEWKRRDGFSGMDGALATLSEKYHEKIDPQRMPKQFSWQWATLKSEPYEFNDPNLTEQKNKIWTPAGPRESHGIGQGAGNVIAGKPDYLPETIAYLALSKMAAKGRVPALL